MKAADIEVGGEYAVQFASWGGTQRVRVLETGVFRTWSSIDPPNFMHSSSKERHDGVRVIWLEDTGEAEQPALTWWDRQSSEDNVVASRHFVRSWVDESEARSRKGMEKAKEAVERARGERAAERIKLELDYRGVTYSRVTEERNSGGRVTLEITGAKHLEALAALLGVPPIPALSDAYRMVLVECYQGGACAGAWETMRSLARLGLVEKDDTRLCDYSVTELGKSALPAATWAAGQGARPAAAD